MQNIGPSNIPFRVAKFGNSAKAVRGKEDLVSTTSFKKRQIFHIAIIATATVFAFHHTPTTLVFFNG